MFDYEIELINSRLKIMLDNYQEIKEPMDYALFPGGKRFRPLLLLLILKDLEIDVNKGLDIACAIEMIHNYSLVHDDLPSMDDDDLRRDKPTLHIAFGEATAVLVGDALLTEAFYWVTKADIDSDKKVKIIEIISKLTGARGMIRGQLLDISTTDSNIEMIDTIHTHKTKDLIECSIQSAVIIADQEDYSWGDIAMYLGKAFQIKDDLDDLNKQEQSTIVRAIGVEEAQNLFFEYRLKCLNLIENKLGKNNTYQLAELVL